MVKKADQKLLMKQKSAKEAAKFVVDGMILGIGSGSTVREFIKILAKSKIAIDSLICIPSSLDTEQMLIDQGFKVGTLNQYPVIDLTVDGADKVDNEMNVIKGGGAALLQEKLIAAAAKNAIIIVDSSKMTEKLGGSFPVPVEVIPKASNFVKKQLRTLEGKPVLRKASDKLGPTITDNGNIIFDTDFETIDDPEEMEKTLNAIPGVMENGLFPKRLIDKVIIAEGKEIRILVKQ